LWSGEDLKISIWRDTVADDALVRKQLGEAGVDFGRRPGRRATVEFSA
jgi:hypothetical protein